MQENPKRHVQHPSHGHKPFEHTGTRKYGDGQILVEQIQDGAHQKVLSLRARSRLDLAGVVLYAGPHRLTYSWFECFVSDRATRAARLSDDAGCLDGNVRGVRPLNERALAGIEDLCCGYV